MSHMLISMIAKFPPGFRPSSIAGLEFWVRADLGITIATGVSEWDDQSGTGDANKNLTQGAGGQQPTLNASDAAYNNKPTLSFVRASSQYLGSGTWAAPLAQPHTIFVVGNDDGSAALQGYFEGDVSGLNRSFIASNNPGAGDYEIYSGVDLAQAAAVSAAPRVLAAKVSGGASALYDSAVTPVATGNAGAGGIISAVSLGAMNGAFFLNGKIAEAIIYNSALSAPDIATVLAYLGSSYGIAIGP